VNLGKWDVWYKDATQRTPYGDALTYQLGAAFLAGLQIEDWGCGYGHFAEYIPCRGVDGSCSPFADEVADLAEYRSATEGLFMRHVLEHDERWKAILDNAVASFTKRMVLVLFTPWAEKTEVLTWTLLGVPDISFSKTDITDRFGGCTWQLEEYQTATYYGVEHVFLLEKDGLEG
jgi:hypothetical protein